VWNNKRQTSHVLNAKTIKQEVEASLKRLDIDVIDLYQIHWPDPDTELEAAWEQIGKAVKEGKLRYAGVCNCNIAQLKRIQPIHPVASLQPPYSMIERGAEESGLLDYCRDQNIGIVAYSPIQKGLLTGKFTRERIHGLPADDNRRNDLNFKEPRLSANFELVEKLTALAKKRNATPAQMAIAWVLRRPEVTSAIVGARRPSQVDETAPAGNIVLTAEEKKAMEGMLEQYKKAVGKG
jgi:aryl-alcohol dehydrogenase-like predicted oxidoreductase